MKIRLYGRICWIIILVIYASPAKAAKCVRIIEATTAELIQKNDDSDQQKTNEPEKPPEVIEVPSEADIAAESKNDTKKLPEPNKSEPPKLGEEGEIDTSIKKSEVLNANPDKVKLVKVPLLKDQIYATSGDDPTGKFTQIVVGHNEYLVPINVAKPIKSNGCFLQPICLLVRNDSFAMQKFSDPTQQVTSIRRGDKFLAVTTAQNDQNDRFFLINTANLFYWVNSRDVVPFTDKTCDEIKNVEIPPPLPVVVQKAAPVSGYQQSNDKYAFGVELGYGAGYSSDSYTPFLTSVPDSSNVGPLSNPVVTEVKKGSGLFVGPILEVRFSESFKIKIGAEYQENTFVYLAKENPTIASNSLDSLPDANGQLKNQSIALLLAPAYEFGSSKHRLGLGVNLRTQYYLSKPNTITYRVGTVFKATEVQVEAGPKGIETLPMLSLYYQWFPGDKSPFALRLTLESDSHVANASLAAFY